MRKKKYVISSYYDNTPNISQLHLAIDKIDNEYIYLYSFRINALTKEGDIVKCSLEDYTCKYY